MLFRSDGDGTGGGAALPPGGAGGGVAVDLPNVAALAARKGNGKAVTVARRIVGFQDS